MAVKDRVRLVAATAAAIVPVVSVGAGARAATVPTAAAKATPPTSLPACVPEESPPPAAPVDDLGVLHPANEGDAGPDIYAHLGPEARANLKAYDEASAKASLANGEEVGDLGLPKPGPAVVPTCIPEVPHTPPAEDTTPNALLQAASGYQSDHALWSRAPSQLYAHDHWVKIGGNANPGDGFWFGSNQLNMTNVTDPAGPTNNSAMHIGPRIGCSLGGCVTNHWYITVDGYNNGTFKGGLGVDMVPRNTWVRVRTWITSGSGTGSNSQSTIGVWAMWDGTDHYQGDITLAGTSFSGATTFVEVYESGQCTTSIPDMFFNDQVYHVAGSSTPVPIASAAASYEANCSNTSWQSLASSNDYVKSVRNVSRTIAQGSLVWKM